MEFCMSGKVMIFFLGGGGKQLMLLVGECAVASSSMQI